MWSPWSAGTGPWHSSLATGPGAGGGHGGLGFYFCRDSFRAALPHSLMYALGFMELNK